MLLIKHEQSEDTSFFEGLLDQDCLSLWLHHIKFCVGPSMQAMSMNQMEVVFGTNYPLLREGLVALYGKQCTNLPNIHIISHLLHFSRQFGAPTLFWGEVFERKHSQYKQNTEYYDPKNPLVTAMMMEAITQAFRFFSQQLSNHKKKTFKKLVFYIWLLF